MKVRLHFSVMLVTKLVGLAVIIWISEKCDTYFYLKHVYTQELLTKNKHEKCQRSLFFLFFTIVTNSVEIEAALRAAAFERSRFKRISTRRRIRVSKPLSALA